MKRDLKNLIIILFTILIVGAISFIYIFYINPPNIFGEVISIPKAYSSSIISGGTP